MLLQRSQVQCPALAWCLTTFCNSRGSEGFCPGDSHTWQTHMHMHKLNIKNNFKKERKQCSSLEYLPHTKPHSSETTVPQILTPTQHAHSLKAKTQSSIFKWFEKQSRTQRKRERQTERGEERKEEGKKRKKRENNKENNSSRRMKFI